MQPSSEQKKKNFSCGSARFFTWIIGTFISAVLVLLRCFSSLSWSRLDRNKICFYIFACCSAFQNWNFVLVRNMKLAPRNEFASSNFVAGSPYSLTPSSPYWTLFTKLITSHFPGFLMENKGGMHDTAFIQRIPPIDSIASCIWDTDSISWPEFKWMAMWDLIVAAFRSQHPFPPKYMLGQG